MKDPTAEEPSESEFVDFRHLSAFHRVYLERSYSHAGHHLALNRKSIKRMMEQLEGTFHTRLFLEDTPGKLLPGPFAERLYNDLRFLHAAQERLLAEVGEIHREGRVVHVGCAPTVFRTAVFRELFAKIQQHPGVRTCFATVEKGEAAKALISGTCDLYLGGEIDRSKRFITQPAGFLECGIYQRCGPSAAEPDTALSSVYYVDMEGLLKERCRSCYPVKSWIPLAEQQWLHWLRHPHDCAEGTLVCSAITALDSSLWRELPPQDGSSNSIPLYASFLQNHPYEFLPSLVRGLAPLSSPV